jgi:hypothetical protein
VRKLSESKCTVKQWNLIVCGYSQNAGTEVFHGMKRSSGDCVEKRRQPIRKKMPIIGIVRNMSNLSQFKHNKRNRDYSIWIYRQYFSLFFHVQIFWDIPRLLQSIVELYWKIKLIFCQSVAFSRKTRCLSALEKGSLIRLNREPNVFICWYWIKYMSQLFQIRC